MPAHPASISPPARRPLHPGALPPSHPRQSSGFRIRPLPTLSGSPSSPTSLLRPTAARAVARDIFRLRFLRRLSSLAPAHALPSASPQTSALDHISSIAARTFPSAPPTKLSSFARSEERRVGKVCG